MPNAKSNFLSAILNGDNLYVAKYDRFLGSAIPKGALHCAVKSRNKIAIRLLLDRKVDTSTKDLKGRSAAMLALELGYSDIFALLPLAESSSDTAHNYGIEDFRNNAQNTHDSHTRASIDASALRLKYRYQRALNVEKNLQQVRAYITKIANADPKKQNALLTLNLITNYKAHERGEIDARQGAEKMSMKYLLALVWQAIHDPKILVNGQRPSNSDTNDVKYSLLVNLSRCVARINRGEPTFYCLTGIFNNIIMTIDQWHPDIKIIYGLANALDIARKNGLALARDHFRAKKPEQRWSILASLDGINESPIAQKFIKEISFKVGRYILEEGLGLKPGILETEVLAAYQYFPVTEVMEARYLEDLAQMVVKHPNTIFRLLFLSYGKYLYREHHIPELLNELGSINPTTQNGQSEESQLRRGEILVCLQKALAMIYKTMESYRKLEKKLESTAMDHPVSFMRSRNKLITELLNPTQENAQNNYLKILERIRKFEDFEQALENFQEHLSDDLLEYAYTYFDNIYELFKRVDQNDNDCANQFKNIIINHKRLTALNGNFSASSLYFRQARIKLINAIKENSYRYTPSTLNGLITEIVLLDHLVMGQKINVDSQYERKQIDAYHDALLADSPIDEQRLKAIRSKLNNLQYLYSTGVVQPIEMISPARALSIPFLTERQRVLEKFTTNNIHPPRNNAERKLKIAEKLLMAFLTNEKLCGNDLSLLQHIYSNICPHTEQPVLEENERLFILLESFFSAKIRLNSFIITTEMQRNPDASSLLSEVKDMQTDYLQLFFERIAESAQNKDALKFLETELIQFRELLDVSLLIWTKKEIYTSTAKDERSYHKDLAVLQCAYKVGLSLNKNPASSTQFLRQHCACLQTPSASTRINLSFLFKRAPTKNSIPRPNQSSYAPPKLGICSFLTRTRA